MPEGGHVHADGDAAKCVQRNTRVIALQITVNAHPSVACVSRWLFPATEDDAHSAKRAVTCLVFRQYQFSGVRYLIVVYLLLFS
jgi:hypothetical protein